MVDRELNQLTEIPTLLPTDLLYVGRGVDEDYKVSTEVLRTFAGVAVQPWARDPAIGLVPASNIDPLIARVSQIPSSVMPTIYGAGAPNAAQGQNGSTYLDTLTGNHYVKAGGAWGLIIDFLTLYGADHQHAHQRRHRRVAAGSVTREQRRRGDMGAQRGAGTAGQRRVGRAVGRLLHPRHACAGVRTSAADH